MYQVLTLQEIQRVAPDLPAPRVVKEGQKFWFVKYKPGTTDQEKRDVLGYELGKNFCNVAEVKLLSTSDHDFIKTQLGLDAGSTTDNTFLIRLANSYTQQELLHTNPEKAVATELVYSLWIRRRDTHALNRTYLGGIPIFFDHETAFLGDVPNAHTTIFLRNSPDYGHPAFWRVRQITGTMTTEMARNVGANERAHHYVNDLDLFKIELDTAVATLKQGVPADLKPLIKTAGFDDGHAELIDDFLKNNLYTLSNDIEQLKKIIFS